MTSGLHRNSDVTRRLYLYVLRFALGPQHHLALLRRSDDALASNTRKLINNPEIPSHHHFPHSQRMATLPNWRPPRWYSAAIPTSVSLLLVHSLAREALFWGSYSWNSQNSILTKCHRPKLQSITATIAQKSSGAIDWMDDEQHSTAWKVALMWLLSNGAVVF